MPSSTSPPWPPYAAPPSCRWCRTTRTSATAPFLDDPDGPKAQLEARIPVGRVGEPEDIARAAAFLCSDEAAFVNGANLMVDGGDSAMAG